MAKGNDFYTVKISIRSSVRLLQDINAKLKSNPKRYLLFRSTVFGPWLDIPYASNDSHLMNYVLQNQVTVSNISPDCPIIYHIGDHYLQFGRKEFCLVTGFRFGKVKTKATKDRPPFCDRVFPEKKTMAVNTVKGIDLLKLLIDDRWSTLSDDDAVRVCLLIACELVFMGREDRNVVPKHIMSLVEDFDEWNAFPWGEYMWDKFYRRTVNVVPKHSQYHLSEIQNNPHYTPTYNLYGFAWAFKVRIILIFIVLSALL